MHMKKLLTLAFALVALASGAMAQEKKIGAALSRTKGTRYGNEAYTARKYKLVALKTTCKEEKYIDKIVAQMKDAGLKVVFEKDDKFQTETKQEQETNLLAKGYDGVLRFTLTKEDFFISGKQVNFEITFTDLTNKISAVKYELLYGVGAFNKGLGNNDKLYEAVLEKVMDDFRQYF
jgi:hypothetical protein